MAKKDLRGIGDLEPEDAKRILALAKTLKAEAKRREFRPLLKNRTLAMLFEKPSLRTRATFDIGMYQLGGHAITYSGREVGLGKRESVSDVARNLERWVDMVVLRTYAQSNIDDLAANCSKPVINALSDHEHPCQAMADFMTLSESFDDLSAIRLAYVGDGNNVAHSLILLGAILDCEIRIGCPAGYEPDPGVVSRAREIHPRGEAGIWVGQDPCECVEDCDAVYTDIWTSMGQESEAQKRAEIFPPYQLNAALLARAKPGAKAMHDLPAHRGEEITDEVIDGPNSIVFEQAENRLHAQKAIMVFLSESTE